MKINQALKKKNQLIREIGELTELAKQNNSIISGNIRRYSVKDLVNEINQKMIELVNLKTAIHTASQPVRNKIFLMSELKNLAKEYQRINVSEGKIKNYGDNEPILYEVEMNCQEVNVLVKELESKIMNLQDELEEFNGITEI